MRSDTAIRKLCFVKSLDAWGSDAFMRALKQEIESLPAGSLPLHGGLAQGGMVDATGLTASIYSASDDGDAVRAKVGLFFNELVAGCSCGDEPMTVNAYCEILLQIDKRTGDGVVELLAQ